ncbi:MAG: PhoX family protein [Cypionkella sp.]
MRLRTLLLAATALTGFVHLAEAQTISFASVPFAADDAAKRAVIATTSAKIGDAEVPLAYHTLARSGDVLDGVAFGQMMALDGKPVAGVISNNPDFTSLLPRNGKLYSVTQFEEAPGGLVLTELAQDADGNLTAVSSKPIDTSKVGGIWQPCAGSVTAWGTHLGSEEYPDNARTTEDAKEIKDLEEDTPPMARLFGLDPATMTLDAFRAVYNPYQYGFATETTVTDAGEASVVKHFGMGRVSMELANVMPDKKTTYISVDGTNVDLLRFVADKEGDLSSGQLFALKWVQTSAENGGEAKVEWIDLGHADDASVQAGIAKGVKFSDLFEVGAFNADGSCPEGFAASNADGNLECLKVKDGMDMLASRLETTRYASIKGGSTEFRKMEGQAYDPATNRLYVAITQVAKGMTDADKKADLVGRNDIRLAKNDCGAVYEMQLGADFVGTDIKALLTGMPKDYAADAPEAGNTCDIDGIASPDNLTFMTGLNTLIIAEDTEGHQNDAIWARDMATGTLTRILSTPYGSEATSVDWYPDVNGHAYLMAVVQHPFGETDSDKLKTADEANAYVGYIGPFPVLK